MVVSNRINVLPLILDEVRGIQKSSPWILDEVKEVQVSSSIGTQQSWC